MTDTMVKYNEQVDGREFNKVIPIEPITGVRAEASDNGNCTPVKKEKPTDKNNFQRAFKKIERKLKKVEKLPKGETLMDALVGQLAEWALDKENEDLKFRRDCTTFVIEQKEGKAAQKNIIVDNRTQVNLNVDPKLRDIA
jgi:hypothetical protein